LRERSGIVFWQANRAVAESFMRAFVIGVATAIVLAIVGAYVLDRFQHPTETAVNIESVRLPANNPG
jgi:hypothetical protein